MYHFTLPKFIRHRYSMLLGNEANYQQDILGAVIRKLLQVKLLT